MRGAGEIALVGLVVLGGCVETGSYHLSISFPDLESRLQTTQLRLYVIDAAREECVGLLATLDEPAPEGVLRFMAVDLPAADLSFGKVPAGQVLFFAEGRTARGERIVRRCAPAVVRGGSVPARTAA